ncbi:MAG: response regulator [Verrucomicrobia bacterium]|nr:response regulator [Verrucomicrobiota bacterium]
MPLSTSQAPALSFVTGRGGVRVLIVDDLANDRELLRMVLEAGGVSVGEASDGTVALALLEREEFDAVISDVLMPRLDGYGLCREIRRHPRLCHLPVIVCTGTYVAAGDEQLALRHGADRHLLKPVSAEMVFLMLGELLRPDATRRHETSLPDDPFVMHEYNAALVRKLESQSRELAERNDELQRVNTELVESRARFERVLSSAMDAIVTLNEADDVVFFNTAAETMFGVSAAAMVGRPLAHLMHGRFGPSQADPIGAFVGAGATGRRLGIYGAISGRRANGGEFPIEAAFSTAEVGGRKFFTVILRDMSERKRGEEQLRLANEQLRALAARTEAVREHERTAIAREIHDVLAQDLTSLKIDLTLVAKQTVRTIDEPTREKIAQRIGAAIAQTDTAITTVQRIATDLRPVILDSLGLPAAIDWQVGDFGRRLGLTCHTRVSTGNSFISRECATAVFRILQESLTNIARHAHATLVDVEFTETPLFASLVVADNGRGITPAQIAAPRSIGLVGMRERAQAFGGTLEITGAPATGTTVRVHLPLERGPAAGPP